MEREITNNELAEQFEINAKLQAERLLAHQEEDSKRFTTIDTKMSAIDTKMESLATKEDIEEMKKAFNDFIYAINLFKKTSKWGYKILLVMASIFVALSSIVVGIRMILGKW